MTAITTERDTQRRDGKQAAYSVLAATKVLAGTLVALTAAGYAQGGAVATTLKASADKATGLSTEIAALKAGGNPDATKWVPLEKFTELNLEVARLSASQVDREVETLLDTARSQGKCSAVVEGVWREVGKTSIAQLKALIDKTPANPALAGLSQTAGKQLDKPGTSAAATADELAMCKNLGLTVEQFRAGAVASA